MNLFTLDLVGKNELNMKCQSILILLSSCILFTFAITFISLLTSLPSCLG